MYVCMYKVLDNGANILKKTLAVLTRRPCTRNQNYGHGGRGNNYSWH